MQILSYSVMTLYLRPGLRCTYATVKASAGVTRHTDAVLLCFPTVSHHLHADFVVFSDDPLSAAAVKASAGVTRHTDAALLCFPTVSHHLHADFVVFSDDPLSAALSAALYLRPAYGEHGRVLVESGFHKFNMIASTTVLKSPPAMRNVAPSAGRCALASTEHCPCLRAVSQATASQVDARSDSR